ncbi:MAG: hypothetical protein ABW164_06295 [Sphingobium sp.]
MNGGNIIVDFWRNDERAPQAAQGQDQLLPQDQDMMAEEDAGGEDADRSTPITIALAAAGLLWTAFALWAFLQSDISAQGPAAWPGAIATIAAPLILLGVGWLLLLRTSRPEARRYRDVARTLRAEADALDRRLGHLAAKLDAGHRNMVDQASLLESYGAAASGNMESSAQLIAEHARTTAERAESAERAAVALAARMETLTQAIPEFEERAARIAARIEDNGHSLAARIDTLEARLHSLTEISDDARARTLGATKSLSGQLAKLQEATRSTVDEVNGMADIAAARIAATLNEAKGALDGSRNLLDAQAEALNALAHRSAAGVEQTAQAAMSRFDADMTAVEARVSGSLDRGLTEARGAIAHTDEALGRQSAELETLVVRSRDAIEAIGGETVAGLSRDMAEIEGRVRQLTATLESQQALIGGLGTSLGDAASMADNRFAALESSALERSERLTEALARMTAEAARIDATLAAGGGTTEKLIGHAEGLMVALDASVRELDETYPMALDRFDARLASSRALLDSATPEMERLEAISEALVGRTQESEEMLRGQGNRLTEWLDSTQAGLEANRTLVERLRMALDEAHGDATRITEGAGPLLVSALLRVKDTADQATERARQALARAVPDAAQALGDASEAALTRAVDEKVTTQIERLSLVAKDAVDAAHQASERLTRQLLTIAETSASVEQRIEEAERAADDRDRDHFARRSAVLIDALNSTSIDVAKLLGSDVADSAWAAYLKGDRGVFTRRAVQLLDAGESQTVASHYDAEPDFHDNVNRYIHDFEAMLRVILSARDGNSLAVAVLSSDMGKLYVALAQAIERFRQ